jgi:hypothetical protein
MIARVYKELLTALTKVFCLSGQKPFGCVVKKSRQNHFFTLAGLIYPFGLSKKDSS